MSVNVKAAIDTLSKEHVAPDAFVRVVLKSNSELQVEVSWG